ncbi:MAG: PKD domain-containing protein, partial [Actinobacteria bacterium]|nr:PKD domain-containing protein [Actinomycetota bacterium]
MSLRIYLLALALFAAPAAAAQAQPVANAGPDQEINCALESGVEVTLNGSASTGSLGYSWTDGTQTATGVTPKLTLPPGEYTFTLTVTDGTGATSTDDVEIVVNPDEAPEIVLKDHSTLLWPPNHKTHPFAAEDLVDEVIDDCSNVPNEAVYFTRATSDEPDDGKGDGNTRDDVSFAENCGEAYVRAERAGTGSGRVYELFLQVADDAGHPSAEAKFRVKVTHDQAHDPDKGRIEARYACESCSDEPSACAEATSGRVTLRDYSKGPSLYWRADGFPEGSVEDRGNRVCLYVDDELAGGSSDPDRVRVKKHRLGLYTKGADLQIPSLPLDSGAEL